MLYNKILLALALSAGFFDLAIGSPQRGNNKGNNNGNNNNGNNQGIQEQVAAANSTTNAAAAGSSGTATTGGANAGGDTTLDPAVIATGSQSDGNASAEKGQSASATDKANFINFCKGKTLTNGLQVKAGSCNGIVMGNIPAQSNMVSQIIVSPSSDKPPAEKTTFDVEVAIANMETGSFTNPDTTYYSAPQDLKNGNIVGHSHITIQDLGKTLTPAKPLDGKIFVFFKGLNIAAVNGILKATVTGGLPAGNYRICTMASASNHQPVLHPVAQRGFENDCTKMTIPAGGAGGAAANGTANAGGTQGANQGGAQGGNQNKGGKGGKGGKFRFAARDMIN